MKRWQALLALVGLFALGVVAGGLGAHLYYARALDRPPGPPPFAGGRMGARLERHLDLSPEQSQRLSEVLRQSRVEGEALRRELAPRVFEVMEHTDERIRELLTDEQRERFDELRRHQRRWDRHNFGPHDGPRGPRRRHRGD